MNRIVMGLIVCGIIVILLSFSTVWFIVRINDLQAQVSTLQTERTSLQGTIDNLGNQTTNLQDQINNLTGILDNLTVQTLQFRSLDLGLFDINSGLFHGFYIPDVNSPVFAGGYSQLSVYYTVDDVTSGNFTLTITLSDVLWYSSYPGPQTFEAINSLNTTVVSNSQGYSTSFLQPLPIQTKAPYFVLAFSTDTNSTDWQNIGVWIRVFVYLKN